MHSDFFDGRYLFSIFETLDGGHDGPASPDGATPRDGLKVNSKAFRPEDAKQIPEKDLPSLPEITG